MSMQGRNSFLEEQYPLKIGYDHSIHLGTDWVLRDLNGRADFISRLVDFDDWQVTTDVFKDLDSLWGPRTVDYLCRVLEQKNPHIFLDFGTPSNDRHRCIYAVMEVRELLVSSTSLSLFADYSLICIIREPRAPSLFHCGSQPSFGPF